MITRIVLSIILLLLVIWECVYGTAGKKNVLTKKETAIAFGGYLLLLFAFMDFTGILHSGYHFVDDHEMYTFSRDFSSYGYWGTLVKWMQIDLHSRFRFTYYWIRITECYFFRDNYLVWHIFQTLIASCGMYFCYIFARKMECPRWLAYGFSVAVFIGGGQSAVLWRLGPQECLATLILMITLLLLVHYQKKPTRVNLGILVSFTVLLGGIKESFLLMLPILPVLLSLWKIRNAQGNCTVGKIWEGIKTEKVYTIITYGVFATDILIIILYVGTNQYGYAGIDQSYRVLDYVKGFYYITTGRLGLYIKCLIYGVAFLVVPAWIQNYRATKKWWQFMKPIWLDIMMLFYLMVVQYILHAKSTMYERYLLPSTIILSAFLLIGMFHFFWRTEWRYGYFIFAVFMILSLIHGVDDENRGILYAEDGQNTTAMLEYVGEKSLDMPNVIVDIDYEMDVSASVILQDKYGIATVYNMNYNKPEGNVAKDAYISGDEETQDILISEADIYMGYTGSIEKLMDDHEIDRSDFESTQFGDYVVYAKGVNTWKIAE